jgi:hypothetical protein
MDISKIKIRKLNEQFDEAKIPERKITNLKERLEETRKILEELKTE